MLDSARLRTELAQIHRTLGAVAASARGDDLVGELRRAAGGDPPTILWLALFADCLRVVHAAMIADGTIADDEIDAVYDFVFLVARRFAAALPTTYKEFSAIDPESARAFMRRWASDRGPYGRGAELHWPGLAMCRRAAELGEPHAIERYEQMMMWLLDAACKIGGVAESDPRWRGRVDELQELRRTLAHAADIDVVTGDLRLQAFLAPSAVFATVQQGASVFKDDPFDVESIHAEVRASFEQMIERATSTHSDRGRMLLVLGASGAGKTHLLRSFRRYVHEYGRGFVAYAQLNSSADNYSRYLLQHVVDSLTKPYATPSGDRTALFELASGLPELVGPSLQKQVDQLAQGSWSSSESLAAFVNRLVNELLRHPDLSAFNPDLLRALLYALRSDPTMTARVYQYLRCEDMSNHDRHWIGDVVPRTGEDDPRDMILQIAKLAYATRRATLVLMVDQAETSSADETMQHKMFRRAVDTLADIVSMAPSATAVVASLSDVYVNVRPHLLRSTLDRLETDPPAERLQLNRSYPEIVSIVARRLARMCSEAGAVYRPEQPIYPIPDTGLRALVNRRTRDVLEWCYRFQARCIAAGKLVDDDEAIEPPKVDAIKQPDLDQIAAAWNDATHASNIEVPDSEEGILAVLAAAAKACVEETGIAASAPTVNGAALRVKLSTAAHSAALAIAVTNRSYHGGAFGAQIEWLRHAARGAMPVAVRTLEFPHGPASDKAVSELLKAGGRSVYVDAAALRTLVALGTFRPPFPAARVAAWRERDRPISSLPAVADIFDLERLRATAPPVEAAPAALAPAPEPAVAPTPTPAPAPPPPAEAPAPRAAPPSIPPLPLTPPRALSPTDLRVGTSSGFRSEPRTLELASLLRHTGILGSPGSGKTTLALNLVEQALERGVAVVLVDRKGDLAGYAKADWWQHAADPERARALAERLDVRLFTPGARGGRPLSLSAVPDLANIPEHERDRIVRYAANALGAMMSLGDTANDTAQRAILAQAVDVLARSPARGGLDELIALLESRDDALIARAGRYDDRLFKRLIQDLETVRLSDAELFDPAAEPLTAETLIGGAPKGMVPLAIASTRFLGDEARTQSWVAHLIACLSRHIAAAPRAELHVLFMIDEADMFMPAGAAKPPSKEPLQDMLRRARAGGLGVILASQSPADFDYRSREQINTWFLGRIADRRSIEKMKPLFEHTPAVGAKLGALTAGKFVMLQDGRHADLDRIPSLLRTEQVSEPELLALAAGTRRVRARPSVTGA